MRLADRALSSTNPLLALVASLIELAGGRLTATEVLDLASAPPVRRRFAFDDDDLARPMQSYVDGLNDYWRRRKDNGTGSQFGSTMRDRIVAALAPDFDLVSTMRSRIRGITHELVRLTAAQREILDGFMTEPRLVIRGGAGTGKTVLAVSEAERLAAALARLG